MLQNKACWPRFTFSQEARLWRGNHYFYSVKLGERAKSLWKTQFGPQSMKNVVRKGQAHCGPKMCTVSRWERQFYKWHPFHAYRGGGKLPDCVPRPFQECSWKVVLRGWERGKGRIGKGCVFWLTVEVFLHAVRRFTYAGGFQGNRKQKRPNPIFGQRRPNPISTVSKKDQTEFQL